MQEENILPYPVKIIPAHAFSTFPRICVSFALRKSHNISELKKSDSNGNCTGKNCKHLF